jgi:NTP pyrophosphatase (non-canonical NTP hydrolase)
MTEKDQLFLIAMEECAEVAQRLSKAARFGLEEVEPDQDHDNARRIRDEYNDLVAVLNMIDESLTIQSPNLQAKKVEKVRHYLTYSQKMGTVT